MRRTASGLIIPGRMTEQPTSKCNVPGCGHLSYNDREQVDHAKYHASQDEDLIQEAVRSINDEIMGEGDPEWSAYLKDRHKKLVKEVGPKEANQPRRY